METIIADKYYSARKLVSMNVLPWKSAMTVYKRLKQDKYKEIFNPIIEIVKGRTSIRIKGENIIKYQELVANGEFNN